MAVLFGFGFEGGKVPTGVTLSTGNARPGVGFDGKHSWALAGSFSSGEQASVSIALGSALSKVGGVYRLRSDTQTYPATLVTFGNVTISLQNATTLRLSYTDSATPTDSDFTITSVDDGWHSLHFNFDRNATTDALTVYWDTAETHKITVTDITGTSSTLVLSGLNGTGSLIDDVMVQDDKANGTAPSTVRAVKSNMTASLVSNWFPSGSPTQPSTGLNAIGLTYAPSTNLYYTIDSAGEIFSIDPVTYATTSVTTVNANYAHCALVYHQALNRMYFVGNGNLAYFTPGSATVTEAVQTVYYTYGSHASGSFYNQETQKAYIVTQTNTGSTNSINVHIIDSAGSYSVLTDSTYTPAAPLTKQFNVCYNSTGEEIVFPAFGSYRVGRVSNVDALSFSSADGTDTVTEVIDAPLFQSVDTIVMSTNSTMNFRKYNSGAISELDLAVNHVDADITTYGVVWHSGLNRLVYHNGTAIWAVGTKGQYQIFSSAIGSTAHILALENFVTGALFFVDAGVLRAANGVLGDRSANLTVKDSIFTQETIKNELMTGLIGGFREKDDLLLKTNNYFLGVVGQGSIKLNNNTSIVSQTPQDIAISEDPRPDPINLLLPDYTLAGSSIGVVDKGSNPDVTPVVTATGTIYNTSTYSLGGLPSIYRFSTINTWEVYTRPNVDLTGDFTAIIIGNGSTVINNAHIFTIGNTSKIYIDRRNLNWTIFGNSRSLTVNDIGGILDFTHIRISRSGTTIYFHKDGKLIDQFTDNPVTTIDSNGQIFGMQLTGNTSSGQPQAVFHSAGLWNSYIADTRPWIPSYAQTPILEKV